GDGQGGSDRHRGQLGPEVVDPGVRHRDHGAQAIVAAGQLDHDQDAVVVDAVGLGRVDGAGEGVGHRGVAGGQARRAGAEDQARPEEVTPLELVDADLFNHRFVAPVYLSWTSGEASARNQRPRSSAAAFSRPAVCGLSTVSMWAGAWLPAGTAGSWFST